MGKRIDFFQCGPSLSNGETFVSFCLRCLFLFACACEKTAMKNSTLLASACFAGGDFGIRTAFSEFHSAAGRQIIIGEAPLTLGSEYWRSRAQRRNKETSRQKVARKPFQKYPSVKRAQSLPQGTCTGTNSANRKPFVHIERRIERHTRLHDADLLRTIRK